MNKLEPFLAGVTIGPALTYENMTIYPLHNPNNATANAQPRSYHTLDEAMQLKELEVTEVSEGGSVPTLTVRNTGKLPILMVVGEELIGAKQNRVLNTSLLVPAESDLQIPVSCVERGRWAYKSSALESSTTTSNFALRKAQTDHVTARLHTDKIYAADQSAVWSEVERTIRSHKSSSPTRALHDVYEQNESSLVAYLNAFPAQQAEGLLIAINGQIVGGDLFDSAETLHTLWPKLIRSYALDALEHRNVPPTPPLRQPSTPEPIVETLPQTQEFMASVQNAPEETYDSVGLGKDVRLSGGQVTGSGLLWQDKLIHASLFNAKV